MNTRIRKHIVMIGCTAPSHIYPSLGLIRELVRRGHRVSYAVGERSVQLIEPTGATPIPHPSMLPVDDWPDDPGTAMRIFLDEGIAVLPMLIEQFDADRPDLVLFDIGGLPGPLLGHRYGVPAVQLSPSMVAWKSYEADMAEFLDALHASESGRSYFETYDNWLAEHGMATTMRELYRNFDGILALIPRAMQPHNDQIPENVRFVGPCLDPDRLTEPGWDPPRDGRRVLLVSFGTAYNDQLPIYRACVAAFGGTPWQVVMAVGNQVDPAELGPLPENIEVHRRVPQLVVLAHASAFITHAGMGGCTEALWFGVPTVAVPQAVDQFGNAAVLAELGVGRHLPAEDVTAQTLWGAVHAVADDPAVAARLADLRAELHANGGVAGAADAVQSFLS